VPNLRRCGLRHVSSRSLAEKGQIRRSPDASLPKLDDHWAKGCRSSLVPALARLCHTPPPSDVFIMFGTSAATPPQVSQLLRSHDVSSRALDAPWSRNGLRKAEQHRDLFVFCSRAPSVCMIKVRDAALCSVLDSTERLAGRTDIWWWSFEVCFLPS
jgi:hypothetical protein